MVDTGKLGNSNWGTNLSCWSENREYVQISCFICLFGRFCSVQSSSSRSNWSLQKELLPELKNTNIKMKGWKSSRESPPCLNEKVTNICFALNLKCPLIEGHNFFRLILHCSFVEPVFMMSILGLLGVWLWPMPDCNISTGYLISTGYHPVSIQLIVGWSPGEL